MSTPKDVEVSPETLERMKKELEELTTVGRDQMSQRLKTARDFGDLKENSEYHAAKDAQGLMEARIRQLQHLISNAVVRERTEDPTTVEPGVIVTVKEGEDEDEYLIAASGEEKLPGIRTVTASSPLGSALMGKSVGETAEVAAPAGSFTVEITAIRAS